METADIIQTWSRLVENGTPEEDLDFTGNVLDKLSVGISGWIDKLSGHYLARLCRRSSHFKMVVGPYGSGKTHFLMALAARALRENYAVAFIKCKQGVSLDDPVAFYQEIAKNIRLPGHHVPGIRTLYTCIWNCWKHEAKQSPDELFVWNAQLEELEYNPSPFGRVSAAYLRFLDNPDSNREVGMAAFRWLNGNYREVGKKEKDTLNLGNIVQKEAGRFGHDLRNELVKIIPNSGVHGLVLLVDESESMVMAKGKALTRVLNAMRTMID